jgi:hypothetical protein
LIQNFIIFNSLLQKSLKRKPLLSAKGLFSIINNHYLVDIVAIVDPSNVILELSKKYIANINVYKSYIDLFNNEKLDAIVICTPPSLHFEISKLAAELKVHVFCEKPFTTSAKDAKNLSLLFENLNLKFPSQLIISSVKHPNLLTSLNLDENYQKKNLLSLNN